MTMTDEFRAMIEEEKKIKESEDTTVDFKLAKMLVKMDNFKIDMAESEVRIRNSIKLVSDKVNNLLYNNDVQVNAISDILSKLDENEQQQVLNYAEFLLSKKN